MNNTKNLLFIYGTLLNKNIQIKLLGKIIKGDPDTFNNHKITEIIIEEEKYPNIYFSINSEVNGMVIRVTKEELSIIDKYETNTYKRVKIVLVSGNKAWVYKKA